MDGTAGHKYLEEYVKAKISGDTPPPVPEGTLKRPVEQFIEWETANVDYWIVSEVRVAYPDKGYAGTLDAIAMLKDGRLALMDFKFASHISEDYTLQMSGYQATFEPYGIKFDDRLIVRLPKTLEREEYNIEEHKYYMKSNDLEVHRIETQYESDRDAFFAALIVKKWINSVINK